MHEMHDAESATRLIAKVIRDLTATMRFDAFADFKDALRRRLMRLRIAYDPADFDAAITVVASNRDLWGTPQADPVAVPDSSDPPLSKQDAADTLARIREHLHRPVTVRTVSRVRETGREIATRVQTSDRARALQIVLDAIADTTARCEALERKP